ncbi:hypothetical protein V494_04385 [Pseudogymnoascus sp. VKM F-4513 (FW-928)]|nr:hypothetical protein V494_04385 [Pseudogymnoascus sp. VKM F-4513 (FW-928)]
MRPRRRRLWQQNSPIAPYSGSDEDESPSAHSDADESNYSDGSIGSNFMPVISKQNTNITTDVPTPVEESTIIQPSESPQQDTITESVEQKDTIIESIGSQELSSALDSLQISATDTPREEPNLPPPSSRTPESHTDYTMADSALPSRTTEPLSDASSHTLGRDSPSNPGASSDPASSSDEKVTDRCYGFLLLHYPKTLPAALDKISVLLIYQRRPHGLHPYWGFPKGHPEPEDRSHWESASRELLEETGLNPERVKPITPAEFSPPLPDSVAGLKPDFMSVIVQYPNFGGDLKEVTYFLGRVAELEELTVQVEELVECRWVKLSEARQLIDTRPMQRVIEKLIGLVSSGPEEVISKSESIRWSEVDALDDNGIPKQWRTVGFCTPE